jgi:hypothetical protein
MFPPFQLDRMLNCPHHNLDISQMHNPENATLNEDPKGKLLFPTM